MVYDLRGSQIARVNARGYRSSYGFDTVGREVSEQDALGRFTTLTFDARGLVATKADGRGLVISFQYDPVGRETSRQYRDGAAVTRVYDAVGQILAAQDSQGIWSRTYDGAGRLKRGRPIRTPSRSPMSTIQRTTGWSCAAGWG